MEEKNKLEFLSGVNKGSTYALTKNEVRLGRAQDNDIVIEDSLVSRHHAKIFIEHHSVVIEDLDTANGTFVNQKRIERHILSSGDIIQIGSETFRFGSKEKMELMKGEPQKVTPKIFQTFLYGAFGLIFIFGIWIWSQKTPSRSDDFTRNIATKNRLSLENEGLSVSPTPPLEREAFTINKEKADRFYESGYRELIEKNYSRAIDDFKAALELFPDHPLARLFLEKAHKMVSEEVDTHYKTAINYFNNGQYGLAIFHFQKVLLLLEKRRPAEDYCTARLERHLEIENPDFEKYCDAKQKISEAETRLTTP